MNWVFNIIEITPILLYLTQLSHQALSLVGRDH